MNQQYQPLSIARANAAIVRPNIESKFDVSEVNFDAINDYLNNSTIENKDGALCCKITNDGTTITITKNSSNAIVECEQSDVSNMKCVTSI